MRIDIFTIDCHTSRCLDQGTSTQHETIEQYASSRNQKPVVLDPKVINLAKSQDKDFRIAVKGP